MRTKTLLCAAVLAAGVASTMAQSNVYSLNVVGYYNVVAPANTKIILGNQLNTTNNTLVGVIPAPAPNSQFFSFNGSFTSYVFDQDDLVWLGGNPSLAPGLGGFFISPVNTTLTFVGEVRQGSLTNTLPNQKALRTSIVPQAGKVTTDLGVPAQANDQLFQFLNSTYSSYVFDADDLVWLPAEPTNLVGEAFFYIKAGNSNNWIRNFTVQ
jgi:hypothetical protein